ncbi:MAG TPA: TolC family protein, partial [Flavihumibacter sp.]|nr:TolC family protein [Flavihumibacter sp.]
EKTTLQLDSASILQRAELKSLDDYLSAADARSDIKALDERREAAAQGIKIARADYYPNLALTGGYVALDIPNFLTVTNAFNVGVGLKYNLSSIWKTESKIQQAKARETQLIVNQSMLQDQVHIQVNKAYQDFLSTRKKIEVYDRAVEQANENYRISKNKYNNSLLTMSDLLDADVLQLQSRLNLEMATADLTLAYQTLLQRAGLIQ